MANMRSVAERQLLTEHARNRTVNNRPRFCRCLYGPLLSGVFDLRRPLAVVVTLDSVTAIPLAFLIRLAIPSPHLCASTAAAAALATSQSCVGAA